MTDDNFPPLPRPWECGLCGAPPAYTAEHMRDYARAAVEAALAAAPQAEPVQPCSDCDALRRTMADLLTRTANALRGDPGPRTAWGWADLPERAAAALAAIDVMQRAAQLAAAPQAAEPSEALREAARMAHKRVLIALDEPKQTMSDGKALREIVRQLRLMDAELREALGDGR